MCKPRDAGMIRPEIMQELERKCRTCKHGKEAPRGEMNVPEKRAYKGGRVLRCINPDSNYNTHIVRPTETCEHYEPKSS